MARYQFRQVRFVNLGWRGRRDFIQANALSVANLDV